MYSFIYPLNKWMGDAKIFGRGLNTAENACFFSGNERYKIETWNK